MLEQAIPVAVDKVEESMAESYTDSVVFVPATGSGSRFDAFKAEMNNSGILYVVTEEPLSIVSNEFV